MMRLMGVELRKLVTTRSTWGIAAGMILVVVMGALQTSGHPSEVGQALTERQFWFLAVINGSIFLAILGVKFVTDEFRYQTIVPTLLVTPRRGSVVAAKLAVIAASGGALAVLAMGAAVSAALPDVGRAPTGAELRSLLLFGVGGALWTAIAGGVGFIVKHQTGAVVGAIVWVLLGEQLIGSTTEGLGDALPVGALGTFAVTTQPGPALAAASILLAYTAAAVAAATVIMRRRDVV